VAGGFRKEVPAPAATKRSQFQLRGKEMNRIEAVSDVVFGFALTLLVISLQAPHTYSDLIEVMRGFPAFALTFAALMTVWVRHYYFFRYYGLNDFATIVLNTLLLFLVLFYVYPLKFFMSVFLANVWLSPLTGMPNQIREAAGGVGTLMTWEDTRGLLIIFGSGFAAVYFVFGAMYWHAYRMREVLGLSAFEIAHTTTTVAGMFIDVGVALLSIAVASVLKGGNAGYAGYVYLLLIPTALLWRRRRRAREAAAIPVLDPGTLEMVKD